MRLPRCRVCGTRVRRGVCACGHCGRGTGQSERGENLLGVHDYVPQYPCFSGIPVLDMQPDAYYACRMGLALWMYKWAALSASPISTVAQLPRSARDGLARRGSIPFGIGGFSRA